MRCNAGFEAIVPQKRLTRLKQDGEKPSIILARHVDFRVSSKKRHRDAAAN